MEFRSNKEKFWAKMAGEDIEMPKPETREEEFMKSMALAIGGQNDVDIPAPITREEKYKAKVIKNLEDITLDLEEKTIIENGEYTAAADNKDGFSKVTVNVPAGNANVADGTGAFRLASALNHIDIPNGYTSIGNAAFSGCTSLASIDLPSTLTSIGNAAFSGCTSLASIDLPSTLTSIDQNTFYQCTSLASIDLPSTLTSIGENAFGGCTILASIDLPSTLTSIGNSAFNGCRSLASIICRATTPPIVYAENAFYSIPADCAIYVPAESVDAYKAASVWSKRANYIQAIQE